MNITRSNSQRGISIKYALIAALLLLVLPSCSDSPKAKIVGKWIEKNTVHDPRNAHVELFEDSSLAVENNSGTWTQLEDGRIKLTMFISGRNYTKIYKLVNDELQEQPKGTVLVRWNGEVPPMFLVADNLPGTWVTNASKPVIKEMRLEDKGIAKLIVQSGYQYKTVTAPWTMIDETRILISRDPSAHVGRIEAIGRLEDSEKLITLTAQVGIGEKQQLAFRRKN